MSLKYRYRRVNKITSAWNLHKIHPLITTYKIPSNFFESFKINMKLYIAKALKIRFNENDKIFINLKALDKITAKKEIIEPTLHPMEQLFQKGSFI